MSAHDFTNFIDIDALLEDLGAPPDESFSTELPDAPLDISKQDFDTLLDATFPTDEIQYGEIMPAFPPLDLSADELPQPMDIDLST